MSNSTHPAFVVVETMPEYLRASHDAAGNSGSYPHNGAERTVMSREDAEQACEEDPDWTAIVNAPVSDYVSKSDVSSWETVASYVSTFPSDDGEGACDVSVQIGEAGGQWYLHTSDDAGGSDECDETAYETRDDAIEAAEDLAADNNEGAVGEDAEDYLTRMLTETAGEPTANGKWCVYWETGGEDRGDGCRDRYDAVEAAQAACDLANKALHEANPGGNLLCGFSVREWVNGVEWVPIDEDGHDYR